MRGTGRTRGLMPGGGARLRVRNGELRSTTAVALVPPRGTAGEPVWLDAVDGAVSLPATAAPDWTVVAGAAAAPVGPITRVTLDAHQVDYQTNISGSAELTIEDGPYAGTYSWSRAGLAAGPVLAVPQAVVGALRPRTRITVLPPLFETADAAGFALTRDARLSADHTVEILGSDIGTTLTITDTGTDGNGSTAASRQIVVPSDPIADADAGIVARYDGEAVEVGAWLSYHDAADDLSDPGTGRSLPRFVPGVGVRQTSEQSLGLARSLVAAPTRAAQQFHAYLVVTADTDIPDGSYYLLADMHPSSWDPMAEIFVIVSGGARRAWR